MVMKQRTPEWHDARKGRITASAVGAILGNSPHGDSGSVMRRMVREWRGAHSEFTGNVATEYGVQNEPGALIEYRMETGHDIDDVGFITREDWAGCSPDGLIGLLGGVEIKCPFSKRKMEPDENFKPLADQPHYGDQVQFSLWVTGRVWWDFVQWAPGGFMSIERVEPCSKWRGKNLPKLRQFFAEYLHERQHNAAVYLEPLRVEIDTPDAHRLVAEYDQLSDAMDRAKERRDEVKEAIVALANGRDALLAGRKVTKVQKDGAVSYAKAVKALLPDVDLEPYRGKPSSYWIIGE